MEDTRVDTLSRMHILIVERDLAFSKALKEAFEGFGARVELTDEVREALRKLNRGDFNLVVCSFYEGDPDCQSLINEFKKIRPEGLFFVLTDFRTFQDNQGVVESLSGVDDYFIKPLDSRKFAKIVNTFYGERNGFSRSLTVVEPYVHQLKPFMLFRSPVMKRVLSGLPRIASSDQTVLISGETGTGKELVARAIHMLSPRAEGPFVSINCGAIPDGLIEGELFGHERGAFTGALRTHRGKFEIATGGTLFLDEIGDMPLHLQVKLLRVLEEGTIYRLGGEGSIRVDVRVIAATRRDLKRDVEEGLFRDDLYYRLNVLRIHLPPLRERRDDIPLLALYFLERAFNELGLLPPYPTLSPGTLELLEKLHWKGNVRELRNLMTRVATLLPQGSEKVLPIHILPHLDEFIEARNGSSGGYGDLPGVFIPIGTPFERIEEMIIRETLRYTGGNRTRAARLLNLSLRTIRRKIRQYNLQGI